MVGLENKADVFFVKLRSLLFFEQLYCTSHKIMVTFGSIIEHTYNIQQSRFAPARRTNYGNTFTLFYFKVDVFKNIRFLTTGINQFSDVGKFYHYVIFCGTWCNGPMNIICQYTCLCIARITLRPKYIKLMP